jgi:hypothetical protein
MIYYFQIIYIIVKLKVFNLNLENMYKLTNLTFN